MLMAENLLLMRRRYRTSVSAAALFLASYGPLGMVLDFADASVAIVSSGGSLDYQSQGQISNGALVGPGAKLTYTAPSLKLTEQADGFIKFQAHNLYLNSASPANQSVTTGMLTGATYAITLTGSVSITLSGAATGTITAGTTIFTAASGTLTCGSTSGSGTVHLRRTPSVDTYVATAGAQVYDLPYVYSGGVRTSILPEPAATNLALYSQEIDNGAYSKSGCTVTANATPSPDGTSNMDRVVETAINGIHSIFQATVYATAGTAYTASVFFKYDGRNQQISFNSASHGSGQYANFDIQNGALGTVVGGSAAIEDVGDGVYRCSFTATATATDACGFSVIGITSLSDTRAPSYTGSTSVGVYVWQYQLETGTVATSPIITYGSPVLRAADTPNALLNLFPSIGTAYTIYAKYKPQSASVATTAIRLDDTTANELVSLGNNASGQGLATVTDGGAAQAAITSGTITASAFHRVAASVEANNVRFVVNGGAEVQDTSVTLPTLTRLLLTAGGGMELVQLAILPGARTEAQLQALGA